MAERASVVIPARYESSRFPGKPLAEIAGEPMICHVVRRGLEAREVEAVYLATDDERIAEAVSQMEVEVRMPEGEFHSGSDRVAAVARELPHEIVINIQGDEPVFPSEALDRGVEAMRDAEEAEVGSFMAPCGRTEAEDPDVVKVVVDQQDRALYFSRSAVPYPRTEPEHWWQHIGIYLYRRDYLLEYAERSPTELERVESLEQLRVLQSGNDIQMVRLEEPTVGVDRPEDISQVEAKLKEME